MTDFSYMLDWKLLKGSHDFPGPDGGTCLNEAAIIAAGFKYKEVGTWRDCPPCFSPITAQFAIGLNDAMDETTRQKLLPFVTQLAGTRGDPVIESRRHEWIFLELVRVDLVGICEINHVFRSHVPALKSVIGVKDGKQILRSLRAAVDLDALDLDLAVLDALAAAKQDWLETRGVELLKGLIAIHPGPSASIPAELVAERLAKARRASRDQLEEIA
jgi:hypothetical protein